MKLAAQLYYKAKETYPELQPKTVKAFIATQDVAKIKTSITSKYTKTTENNKIVIKNADGKVVTRMAETDGEEEIKNMIDNELLDYAVDALLEYVYDTLSEGGSL